MTGLDLLFNAYLFRSGKTKKEIAEHLNVHRKSLQRWWAAGVDTWAWKDIIKAAQFLGIPIDALRECLTYRREKK